MTQLIHEYVQETSSLLIRFLAYWMDEQIKSPERFPLEQEEGEWEEQFQNFVSTQDQ